MSRAAALHSAPPRLVGWEWRPPTSVERVIADLDESALNAMVGRLTAATSIDLGDVPGALSALPTRTTRRRSRLRRRLGWTIKAIADWADIAKNPASKSKALWQPLLNGM